MTRIVWNEENNKTLFEMFNADKTDLEISAQFGDAGTFAIAKQRSRLGLLYRKMPKGLKHKPRTVIDKSVDLKALYYVKDGQNHFCTFHNSDDVLDIARKVIRAQDIKNIVVLQPAYLLTKGSQEIIDLTI